MLLLLVVQLPLLLLVHNTEASSLLLQGRWSTALGSVQYHCPCRGCLRMKRRGRSFHDVLLGLIGSRFDLLDLFQRCFIANVSLRDGRQRLTLSVLGLFRILLFSLHGQLDLCLRRFVNMVQVNELFQGLFGI